jgi:hypothetical protein
MRTSSSLRSPRQNEEIPRSQTRSQVPLTGRNDYDRNPPPIRGESSRGRPRQTDNGWPLEKRQSTLPGHWGSQNIASSSTQRSNLPPPAHTQ